MKPLKTRCPKYTSKDALLFVIDKGLSVPEALRATCYPCTKQNLYYMVANHEKILKNQIVTVNSDCSDVSDLTHNTQTHFNSSTSSSSYSVKRHRKSSKQKNLDLVERNNKKKHAEECYNTALSNAINILKE